MRITNEWRMALKNLYPGAAYQLKVFAISHGLLSEPHDYFQAVCELINLFYYHMKLYNCIIILNIIINI